MSKTKKIVLGICSGVLALVIIAGIIVCPRFAGKSRMVWDTGSVYSTQEIPSLEKQPGKDFKILQLTDTQLFTSKKENKEALDLVQKLIREEQPDLVIFTGDNVSGFFNVGLLKDFIACVEEMKVPWAPVFGNHDPEGKATLRWQGKMFQEAEHCLYQPGPDSVDGEGNYIINIKENGEILESLILLDSHNRATYPDGNKGYAYITQNQIEWYEWAVKGVSVERYGSYNPSDGKVVPSMAFFHIALPEMKTALEPYLNEDGVGTVPSDKGFGAIREGIACPGYNSGFFAKARELGSTTDIFVGHDHANDASVTYQGIRMTYGVKTGPSPHQWNEAVAYGGTRITLKDQTNQVEIQHIYDSYVK